ncbi:hypothetical protein K438DRAFT_1937634 [Mycena galopus ATCC 62051]|nr:hypothetical protein K438DRAFT_1937634 [Mycena galopus ATCC 62051]
MAQQPGPSGGFAHSMDSDIGGQLPRVVSPDASGTGVEEGETKNQPNRVLPNAGDGGLGNRPGTSGPALRTHRPFGLKSGEKTAGLAPNDYRQKYAEDPLYRELEDEARVWHVYNDESAIFDNDMLIESGDSLDILLVFAGLFSGVLTTFVSQTSQALSPDNTAISNSILLELVALQRAQANGTSIDLIPVADLSFTVALSDLWVNGLWFTSLALSLTTALFAVVAKQWLRQYSSFIAGSARDRATIRQFRYKGFDQWGVQFIIGLLPTVLHLSLFLFLAGLVVFLYALDHLIAKVVAGIAVFLCNTYIVMNMLPILVIDPSGWLSAGTQASELFLNFTHSKPSPSDKQNVNIEPSDERLLLRLIQATISQSQQSPKLERPYNFYGYCTLVVAIAACCHPSTFQFGDSRPILAPDKTLNFILNNYTGFEELVVPVWMWLSICLQATRGVNPSIDSAEAMLFSVSSKGTYNTAAERKDIWVWFNQHAIPDSLHRAVNAKESWGGQDSRYDPVPLSAFLAMIQRGTSFDDNSRLPGLKPPCQPLMSHPPHTFTESRHHNTSQASLKGFADTVSPSSMSLAHHPPSAVTQGPSSFPIETLISQAPSAHSVHTLPDAGAHSLHPSVRHLPSMQNHSTEADHLHSPNLPQLLQELPNSSHPLN